MHRRITDLAAGIDRSYGIQTVVDIDLGYPCVVNDTALVALATDLAKRDGQPIKMLPLRTTAEDFGYYCQHYPSLFYRLGVGSASGRTHTATFAPDEKAIAVGIDFMHRLALQILTDKNETYE